MLLLMNFTIVDGCDNASKYSRLLTPFSRFANIKKCSPEGRRQMQIDYEEYLEKLKDSTAVK